MNTRTSAGGSTSRQPSMPPKNLRFVVFLVLYSTVLCTVLWFISNLATKTEPLRQILKKNTEFLWNEPQQKAFLRLKEELKHPVGLGSVLVQEQNGQMRIIAYASENLTDVERRYSQTEREALSLVWA